MPEWQRLAGKAAKEVEKFAKEKVDLVLMHWRDRMGIAQKEVKVFKTLGLSNLTKSHLSIRTHAQIVKKHCDVRVLLTFRKLYTFCYSWVGNGFQGECKAGK